MKARQKCLGLWSPWCDTKNPIPTNKHIIVNENMNKKCNEKKKLSLDVMENDGCSHIDFGIV